MSHQLVFAMFQTPEPPKPAPVDALLPAIEPSVSQYKVPARTGAPNFDTASMAEIATTTVRSAFVREPVIRFAMDGFNVPLLERTSEAPAQSCAKTHPCGG